MSNKKIDLTGEGKGGGGRTFRADENTLRSNVYASVIEAWGEGPILGPVEGKKSVYLNNTPLVQKNGTPNFGGKITFPPPRLGEEDQTLPPGFELAGTPTDVSVDVTFAEPQSRRTTDPATQSVEVTISLPQGLYEQKTDENSIVKTTVELAISIKMAADDNYIVAIPSIKYDDKTTSPYQETFAVPRPEGTTYGLFDIQLSRLTPDNASDVLHNQTAWAYFTELQPSNTAYPDVAFMALEMDANAVNMTSIPSRSAIVNGLKVLVPSNFNTKTRQYTTDDGTPITWDGEAKTEWTDDPAWIVFALATNERWGLGLPLDQMDVYSFIAASKYNSQLVEFTTAGTEVVTRAPRYSYNYQINTGEAAVDLLNKVASVMHAKIAWVGGQLTVLQDRPSVDANGTLFIDHVFNRTKIVGAFKYTGTPRQTRTTVCDVTWNDPEILFGSRVSSYSASPEELATNGFNKAQITMNGVTNEPQAIRDARWYVDSSINSNESVTFQCGPDGRLVLPHQVIETYDDRYALQTAAGRLLAGSSSTTLILDRPVNLSANATITLQLDNGTIYKDKAITTTGTVSTIVLDAALPVSPAKYTVYNIKTNNIAGRLWRVESVTEEERNVFTIKANTYDHGKYARIETGVTKEAYEPTVLFTTVGAPTGLAFEERVSYVDGKLVRNLAVTWLPSASGVVNGYVISWKKDGGAATAANTQTTFYELQDITPGTLEVRVTAISPMGLPSAPLVGYYTIGGISGANTPLPPEDLWIDGDGGTIFSTDDLTVSWLNPAGNDFIGNTALLFFDIEVYNGLTLLRKEVLPGVPAGTRQVGTYTYEMNLIDGGPYRSITVSIAARYTGGGTSEFTTQTFTNPPPGIPLDIKVEAGIGSNKLSYVKPTDLDWEGVLVWSSPTIPFELNEETLIYEGVDTSGTHTTSNPVQYYRFACYDSYAKDYTGATLNLSAVYSSAPVTIVADVANNKLLNSGFEGRQPDGRPIYWLAYVGSSATITYTQYGTYYSPAGYESNSAMGVLLASGTTTKLGITPNLTEIEGAGVNGGWKPGTTYTISFYAKKVNGAGMTKMGLDWVIAPAGGQVEVQNPNLTTDWQRYIFTISWSDSIEADGALAITALGTFAVGDQIIIDNAQVETGSVATDYKPRIEEQVALSPFNVDGQINDTLIAAIAEAAATGTVDEARIAGLSASKITGQLTNDQLAAIDAAKLVGTLSPAQIGIIDAANLTGKITSTQITDGAITTPKIATGAILTAHIGAGQVTAGTIAAGSITGTQLAANSIQSGHIVSGTILAGDIAAGTITGTQIEAGTITGAKIAAGTILASNIAAGAITTGKLFVTGQGKALNNDPFMKDITTWIASEGAFASQADVTAPIGTTSMRLTNSTQFYSEQFPIEPGKTYKVALWAKQVTGGGTGNFYLRIGSYDANGNTKGYQATGITHVGSLENLTIGNNWTRVNGYVRVPTGGVIGRAWVVANYGTTGIVDITDLRVEEYIGADLIVDGTISATKLVTNSITATQIGNNAIYSTHIAPGEITLSKLSPNSVDASKILPTSITGDRISSNTINTNNIVVGGVSQSATSAAAGQNIWNGAAAGHTSGTITGPTLVTIGRSVYVSFDGTVQATITGPAIPYEYNMQSEVQLKLTRIGTGTPSSVSLGSYPRNTQAVLGLGTPYFRQTACGFIPITVPAGTWRLDAFFDLWCYAAEATNYGGVARGALAPYVTNLVASGIFSMFELKV